MKIGWEEEGHNALKDLVLFMHPHCLPHCCTFDQPSNSYPALQASSLFHCDFIAWAPDGIKPWCLISTPVDSLENARPRHYRHAQVRRCWPQCAGSAKLSGICTLRHVAFAQTCGTNNKPRCTGSCEIYPALGAIGPGRCVGEDGSSHDWPICRDTSSTIARLRQRSVIIGDFNRETSSIFASARERLGLENLCHSGLVLRGPNPQVEERAVYLLLMYWLRPRCPSSRFSAPN
jgi:hypothetical protein